MQAFRRITGITFLVAALVSLPCVSGAQIPNTISYQGILTNAAVPPVIVPDGSYNLVFKLYTASSGGSPFWTETHNNVSVAEGRFYVELGSLTSLTGVSFGMPYFLGITVNGGTELPRIAFTSSAYSLNARRVATVDSATGGAVNGAINLRSVVAGNTAIGLTPVSDGRGNINLSRGDGFWGIMASGTPSLSLYGTARSAFFEMSQAGTESVRLPSSAIEASEMLDEPGVGSDNNTGISLTGPTQYLAGRTMTAPVDGYVLVIATASLNIQHSNGTGTSCAFGVSDDVSRFVESTVGYLVLPSSLPTGVYEYPVASHALFPITAGSQAYYALGARGGATAATVYDVQLTECFFPTAYTTVSLPVAPSASTAESAASFDPEAERLQAQAFYNARVQGELDRMKAELEAVRQELSEMKNTGESDR